MIKINFRLLLVLFLLLAGMSACNTALPGRLPDPTPTTATVTTPTQKKLSISTDPRLELMAVLLSLFDYQSQDPRMMAAVDFAYKQDVAKTFGPFRDHQAVQILKEITPNRSTPPNFNHDAPVGLMLAVSNPPELTPQNPFSQELIFRASGQANLDALLAAMRDFASQTHFMDFYTSHQDFYQQITVQADRQFKEQDLSAFENYYGVNRFNYQVILVPLFGQGSFGMNTPHPDGSAEINFVLGTQRLDDEQQPVLAEPQTFRRKLWHEFGHSFVNPLTGARFKEIEASQKLYEPIANQMTKLMYGNWGTTVNEHIIRAVVIRLVRQVEGQSAADKLLEEEKGRGFIYLDGLLKKLEVYEQSRNQYLTFESFYSELLKGFHE